MRPENWKDKTMGQRNDSQTFETQSEAQAYAEAAKASAILGYSEVYVTGPHKSDTDGLWHVSTKTYYG